MFILRGSKNYHILLVFLALTSCTSKKNLLYFQGSGVASSDNNRVYNPVLKKDDLLNITVMGMDPKASEPFNLPTAFLSINNAGGYYTGAVPPLGFLIDANGYIEFPVIGQIKMAGLTRMQAVDTLRQKLTPYLNRPTVILRIVNFKVTVLGEVRNPGTITLPSERVTLPEAIGIAGDLLITGVRQTVLVIREVDGIKTETRVDLTSKDLFNSPVYYLQQNDIVYVEPNQAKINSSVINAANVGLAISILSLILTMATLISSR